MKPKELRRVEGEERNEVWRSLSAEQKLRSLQARRGESKRQIKKLLKELGRES